MNIKRQACTCDSCATVALAGALGRVLLASIQLGAINAAAAQDGRVRPGALDAHCLRGARAMLSLLQQIVCK